MDQTDWKGESVSGCINLESMCLELNRIIETQLLFARCVPCAIAPFGILPTLLDVYVRLNGGLFCARHMASRITLAMAGGLFITEPPIITPNL